MIRTDVKRRRPLLSLPVLLLALGSVAPACKEDPVSALGRDNDPVLLNVPDEFRYQASDLLNVRDRQSWSWINNGTSATIEHRNFLSHGEGTLVLLDATGKQVYRGPLEYEQDHLSVAGTPGTWTVQIELDGALGRLDFRILRLN